MLEPNSSAAYAALGRRSLLTAAALSAATFAAAATAGGLTFTTSGGTITFTLQYSTESGDTAKQINTNTLNATTLHGAAQSCTFVYTKAGTLVGFLSSGGAGAACFSV